MKKSRRKAWAENTVILDRIKRMFKGADQTPGSVSVQMRYAELAAIKMEREGYGHHELIRGAIGGYLGVVHDRNAHLRRTMDVR